MANLSPTQEAALEAVASAHADYVREKSTLEQTLRIALARDLAASKIRRDVAAFDAFRLGVPKRRIGLIGLSTSAPQTYQDAIENGRQYASATPATPTAESVEAATPTEAKYATKAGDILAGNDPFTLGDEPGTFTFTCDTGSVLIRAVDAGDGVRMMLEPADGDWGNAAFGVFSSGGSAGERLREDARKFMAGV